MFVVVVISPTGVLIMLTPQIDEESAVCSPRREEGSCGRAGAPKTKQAEVPAHRHVKARLSLI